MYVASSSQKMAVESKPWRAVFIHVIRHWSHSCHVTVNYAEYSHWPHEEYKFSCLLWLHTNSLWLIVRRTSYLINHDICWFIRETVQIELRRLFNSCVARPFNVAFPSKHRDQFYGSPDSSKGDNYTFSCIATSCVTLQPVHIYSGVSLASHARCRLEGLHIR